MKHLLIAFIRWYQRGISPAKPPSCRFTPTCSAYALEALRIRRLPAALLLIVYRILRCNPLCRGGYDPVPESGFRAFSGTGALPFRKEKKRPRN